MWKTGKIIRWVLCILVVIDALFFLKSCSQTPKGVDPFYTNKGEWDDAEIPIIKPYQLVILNGSEEWGMSLQHASMLGDVKRINVLNSYIFVYSRKTYFNFQGPEKVVWAVINPSKKLEKTFETYTDYVRFVNENGFQKEPVLHDVKDVSRYSLHHDVMDWKELNTLLKH